MFRRAAPLGAQLTLLVVAPLSWMFSGCGDSVTIGNIGGVEAPSFSGADAGTVETDAGPTDYCPVTTCSFPWATCDSSRFPCDTDLSSDDDNCGGCGVRCGGAIAETRSKWSCVEGQCTFSCTNAASDCDDDFSNGCEANLARDANNCGQCGKKCPDGLDCREATCVDDCVYAGFPDHCAGGCTDLSSDDANCGSCGTVCDPEGPGKPALASGMYYGCVAGTCGHPKCSSPLDYDCNGDPSDGCETALNTVDDCGACGNKCGTEQVCAYESPRFRCMCDDGEHYCGVLNGCRRLDDDPLNCGGCNRACPGITLPHFQATCSFGVCGGNCESNYADCDGVAENGCESRIDIDNRNCGGCGRACLPDQVCSGGSCLVAPCSPEGQAK